MPTRTKARPMRRQPVRKRAARLAPGARRTLLLDAALRVFALRGLRTARHAEIAEAAGVSVSAVFVYFPTRTALVEAVVAEIETFYGGLVDQSLAGAGSAPAALLQLSRTFAASVDTHPDHARVWLDWSTTFGDGSWPRYRAFQERVVRSIAAAIEHGQREGTVARTSNPRARRS